MPIIFGIAGIVLILVIWGLLKRFSNFTGIPARYALLSVICWLVGGILFYIKSLFIVNTIITIGIIIISPLVLIAILKILKIFISWAIGGITE